jgi:hypothetical protein
MTIDRSAIDRVLAANRYRSGRHHGLRLHRRRGAGRGGVLDADAAQATAAERDTTLQALNSRLAPGKRLGDGDLQPRGPLVAYRADLRRRYALVRGGDPEHPNVVDTTVEI